MSKSPQPDDCSNRIHPSQKWLKVFLFAGMAIGVLLLAACIVDFGRAWRQLEIYTLRHRIRGVVETDDRATTAQNVHRCFQGTSNSGIAWLRSHPDERIALFVAWEEFRRDILSRSSTTTIFTPVDPRAMNRFIAFVEERLTAPIPEWWKKVLARAEAKLSNVRFGSNLEIRIGLFYGEGVHRNVGLGLSVYEDIGVKNQRNNVELALCGTTIRFPLVRVAAAIDNVLPSYICAAVSSERCCFAIFDNLGSPYSLYCGDEDNATAEWYTEVWAKGDIGFHIGPVDHRASIVFCDSRVMIFGIANNCAYIEGFSRSDGKNLFRFFTDY